MAPSSSTFRVRRPLHDTCRQQRLEHAVRDGVRTMDLRWCGTLRQRRTYDSGGCCMHEGLMPPPPPSRSTTMETRAASPFSRSTALERCLFLVLLYLRFWNNASSTFFKIYGSRFGGTSAWL
ncbi:hypothetical protein SESBI_06203 [Sesbania bispinosa]|nr:hypothetical protein SESBI_06203 [Sesbania bispinosa]